MNTVLTNTGTRARFASVDSLSGLTVAAMLLVNDAGDGDHVHPWLEHAAWNGSTPADFIFPFFLFIVGVSISLSLDAQLTRSGTRGSLARKILSRGARIIAVGLVLAAVKWWLVPGTHGYRPMGVLQRIGFCYTAGALLALYVRDVRLHWLLFTAVLLGYWALLASGGPLLPGANLADQIDSAILGSHAYLYDVVTRQGRDPEGLLSTLPAVATVILGMQAGGWLRAGLTGRLLWVGVAALGVAALWAPVFPINKQLWTSSFVLWTGGAALVALTFAHWVFDIRGWPAVGRSLGINAITAYAASWVTICALAGSALKPALYQTLFAGPLGPPLPPWIPSLAFALAITALFWIAISVLTRRGWRLTI